MKNSNQPLNADGAAAAASKVVSNAGGRQPKPVSKLQGLSDTSYTLPIGDMLRSDLIWLSSEGFSLQLLVNYTDHDMGDCLKVIGVHKTLVPVVRCYKFKFNIVDKAHTIDLVHDNDWNANLTSDLFV